MASTSRHDGIRGSTTTLINLLLITLCWVATGGSAQAANLTVCASGCNYTRVQDAVNAAAAGDRIVLHAGTTYTESVTLPNKGALTDYISITSDANPANLPNPGVRITPAY